MSRRDCQRTSEKLDIRSSRDALLKATLSLHRYTVPAKYNLTRVVEYLWHEAAAYSRLRPIQGIYIPLYLGSIDLAHPYSYGGIAYIEHMMLWSLSSQPLDLMLRKIESRLLSCQGKESFSAMHRPDNIHKDRAPRGWSYSQGGRFLF